MRSLTPELPSQEKSRTSVTECCITCDVVSSGLPSWVCGLSWTLSAELLEGGAEEGRIPPPAGAAGLGTGGLAAMAGLGGKGPVGRFGRAGFKCRGGCGWNESSALIGYLGSAEKIRGNNSCWTNQWAQKAWRRIRDIMKVVLHTDCYTIQLGPGAILISSFLCHTCFLLVILQQQWLWPKKYGSQTFSYIKSDDFSRSFQAQFLQIQGHNRHN